MAFFARLMRLLRWWSSDLLPRPEWDVVHRVAAEGAVGVEDVPFDEQGALLSFGEVIEVVVRALCEVAELCVGEVFVGDG